MTLRLTTPVLLNGALTALGAASALTLLVVLVNLPWFDEPLRPELVELASPRPVSMQGNAYAIALGFLAADDRDPGLAGREIIRTLRERFERDESLTLGAAQMEAMLGGPDSDAAWRSELESLACNARLHLDCAERLIAEVVEADLRQPRLSVLLERYGRMLGETRFTENEELAVYSPAVPFRALMDIGRLRLAISYRRDATHEFLRKLFEDFEFWRTVLRDGQTLVSKMVSLAGIQNDLDFLASTMRNVELSGDELGLIRSRLRPFTDEELDIGEAFLSEARIAVLSEPHPAVMSSSWMSRLLVQENATLNQEYSSVFVPMRLRASLDSREYYRREAYKPLDLGPRTLDLSPFNWGGRSALRSTWNTVHEYVNRVHDQNGRISLVLLQAEMDSNPEADVRSLLRSSIHRDPYTGTPMEYDAEARTIGFQCLHSAFHPPNPPDACRTLIAR